MPRRPPRTPRWLQAARAAGSERPQVAKPDWIGRALPRAGLLRPEEVEPALKAGRVRIGPRVVTELLAPLPVGARVFLDGREVSVERRTIALMFHKPKGLVTSAVDEEERGTVFQALDAVLSEAHRRYHWHAIGRLDRNTTGLLLFTNDERLVAHVTRPETHLEKRYLAHVLGQVTEEKLSTLRRGMTLDDGPTRPAKAVLRAPGLVELTLTEGRNHQVKRMLGALGLPVTQLHREAVGKVVCDVEVGRYRPLEEPEITLGLEYASPDQARADA